MKGLFFSSRGDLFAFFSTISSNKREKCIRVYDIQQQLIISDLVLPTPYIGTERSQSLAFSPDNTYLVATDIHGILYFWDIAQKCFVSSFSAHDNPGNLPYYGIRSVAWSAANNCLATGGWDSLDTSLNGKFVIKLWETYQI